MPAGSHMSSSGGHGGLGGGGHFSSSSSRSGNSYSNNTHRHGPTYIHIGGRRTVIVSNGRYSALPILFFGMFFALVTMIALIGVKSSTNLDIDVIKTERAYYLAMIQNAEEDSSYKRQATVTDQKIDYDYDKYQIWFRFEKDDYFHTKVEGYSFFVYDLENVPKIGSKIDIAVNNNVVDGDTDAIPMDYVNFELKDDAEYLAAVSSNNTANVIIIICILAIAGCLVGVVFVIKKAKNKKDDEKHTQEDNNTSKTKYCEYCGAKILESDRTCPNCGARIL